MAVTIDDVAVALGRTSPDLGTIEALQWDSWITQARLLIKAKLGDLALLDQEILDYVTVQAVVAQARKPDDSTSVSVQVDDTTSTRRYSSSTGRVFILPEWWALLDPANPATGAFSVRPHGKPDDTWCWPTVWP